MVSKYREKGASQRCQGNTRYKKLFLTANEGKQTKANKVHVKYHGTRFPEN